MLVYTIMNGNYSRRRTVVVSLEFKMAESNEKIRRKIKGMYAFLINDITPFYSYIS